MARRPHRAPVLLVILALPALACTSSTGDDSEVDETGTAPEWVTVFFDDFNRADGSVGSGYIVVIYDPVEKAMRYDAPIAGGELTLTDGWFAVRYGTAVTGDTLRVGATFRLSTDATGTAGFSVAAKGSYGSGNELVGAYGGGAGINDIIGIYVLSTTGGLEPLATRSFDAQVGGSYRLELTVAGSQLVLTVKDLATGTTQTLSATGSGSPLTGTTVSLNGALGEGDQLTVDDFRIEEMR